MGFSAFRFFIESEAQPGSSIDNPVAIWDFNTDTNPATIGGLINETSGSFPLDGSITVFADAGGGNTRVTSPGHLLSDNQTATISGTTNYNGSFVVSNVVGNTFDIPTPFVGNDATGTWKAPGDLVITGGFSNTGYTFEQPAFVNGSAFSCTTTENNPALSSSAFTAKNIPYTAASGLTLECVVNPTAYYTSAAAFGQYLNAAYVGGISLSRATSRSYIWIGANNYKTGTTPSGNPEYVFALTNDVVYDRRDDEQAVVRDSTAAPLSETVHLMGVIRESANEIEFYINGASIGTDTIPVGWYSSGGLDIRTNDIVLGTQIFGARDQVSFTAPQLNEQFGVYETALTSQQVADRFNFLLGGSMLQWLPAEPTGSFPATQNGAILLRNFFAINLDRTWSIDNTGVGTGASGTYLGDGLSPGEFQVSFTTANDSGVGTKEGLFGTLIDGTFQTISGGSKVLSISATNPGGTFQTDVTVTIRETGVPSNSISATVTLVVTNNP